MSIRRASVSTLLLALLSVNITYGSQSPLLQKVSSATDVSGKVSLIDTRPLTSCQKSSLNGATCLPIEDVLAPNRRLANWSGILWLLGTAGLSGNEHVVVTGQRSDRRDFIAGLLILAGQRKVTVVDTPLTELVNNNDSAAPGKIRATTRTSVYTAPMRSELIVLRNELEQLVQSETIILDGRSESEYYGAKIRAARGGHLPGATHSPLSEWRINPAKNTALYKANRVVAYAHDTFEGLAYFSNLLAAGTHPGLYLAGWNEWASNASLPADSVSYPQLKPIATGNPSSNVPTVTKSALVTTAPIGAVLVILLLGVGFLTGRYLPGRTV